MYVLEACVCVSMYVLEACACMCLCVCMYMPLYAGGSSSLRIYIYIYIYLCKTALRFRVNDNVFTCPPSIFESEAKLVFPSKYDSRLISRVLSAVDLIKFNFV